MSKFKIGDVCIYQNLVEFSEFNGRECTVVGELCLQRSMDACGNINVFMGYAIDDSDGEWTAEERCLRLKRPPSAYDGDSTGEWDLCPWRPGVKAKESA